MSPYKHLQDEVHALSLRDPESFWSHQAAQLHWHKPPTRALKTTTKKLKNGVEHPHWSWFPDGEISTTYNCLDRHVLAGNGDNIAIIWDSPVSGNRERYTYRQVLEEVKVLAGVLREEGVRKGDVVLIYMPMVPAAVFAMLAIARLGAIHAVVFGGFSPPALAQRIDACHPRAIMTASCGIEGAKGPIGYKSLIEGAVSRSAHKPPKIIVWQRDELRWDPIRKDNGERNWQRLTTSARKRGVKADAVPVAGTDGLYIIYTSGTTGLPKGVLREAGGHAVGLNLSIKYVFGVHGPQDVMLCLSDIGWVVGHSYIVYAPLLVGATTILFEGKPVGTPDAGTFWRLVEDYKVTTMFTAPTALRAIRRDDGDNEFFRKVGERGGLKSLRALFLAGERSEPSIVTLYKRLLEKYAAGGAQVIDHWWSSESGSPMTAIALSAEAAKDFTTTARHEALPIRVGSAGRSMPGYDIRIVDDEGKEVKKGMGNIVLGIPWAPTALTTLYNDEERFYKGYLRRFNGKWIDTGDAGMIDSDGYVHVMSRTDDVINVAAHRFSTGQIEQAITSHPEIAEACVVGIPDALKGHLPFAFITLTTHDHPTEAVPDDALFNDVQKLVREQIGAIASLGGMIQGKGMIPKTRSGKTLRRVLRELIENAVHGNFEKEVAVPTTIEDLTAVDLARGKVKEYFEKRGKDLHKATEAKAKL